MFLIVQLAVTMKIVCYLLSSFLHFLKYTMKYTYSISTSINASFKIIRRKAYVSILCGILGEKQIESNILFEMMDLYFLNFFTKNKAFHFSHVIFSSTKIESDICFPNFQENFWRFNGIQHAIKFSPKKLFFFKKDVSYF